jgi:hypothetical protein
LGQTEQFWEWMKSSSTLGHKYHRVGTFLGRTVTRTEPLGRTLTGTKSSVDWTSRHHILLKPMLISVMFSGLRTWDHPDHGNVKVSRGPNYGGTFISNYFI